MNLIKNPFTLALVFSAVLGGRSFGETLVVSDGATNSIVVGTNESIIIDFIDTNSSYSIYKRSGMTNIVDVQKGSAFAGPSELLFFSYSTVVTFHRLQTIALTTVVLGANDTNTIVVPTNTTLKVFATDGSGKPIVSRGSNSRTLVASGCELTGPLTVTMTGHSETFLGSEYRQIFSYYFTEDFLQVTADGYLRGPSGTFEVLVEKSTDLTQWLPVMVQSTATSDTRAFYRLRIQK